MNRASQLYRIKQPFEGRLAVSRRPFGFEDLDDDMGIWRAAGVDVVVSMMEGDEAEEMGLANEREACLANGLEFISCPVPDHGIPGDVEAVLRGVDHALARLGQGHCVAAHCFAGIGRSPLFVAATLVRYGLDVDLAWQRIVAARGLQLPDTTAQRRWVSDFAARFGPPARP